MHKIKGIVLDWLIPYSIKRGYKGLHTVLVRDITELLQQKQTLSLFQMNGYKGKHKQKKQTYTIFAASKGMPWCIIQYLKE